MEKENKTKQIAIRAIEHSIFCNADILTEYYDSADEYFEKNFGCTVNEAEVALGCKFAIRGYWANAGVWSEIRCNHFDEKEKQWYVDAWRTADDNEEGTTIAKIDLKGNIEYLDELAKTDSAAQELILDVRNQILYDRLA